MQFVRNHQETGTPWWGENFDPDEETIVKESDNKKDIEDAFNESKDDFDLLYVVLNDESYAACSKGSKLIWK